MEQQKLYLQLPGLALILILVFYASFVSGSVQKGEISSYIIEFEESPVADKDVVDKEKQNEKIKFEQERAVKEIEKKLKKVLKIRNKYSVVFNGLSLEMSEEEARIVKEIKGVKGVYPNLEVYSLMQDSLGINEAVNSWKLDKNGGNCSETGLECMTGKGVSIAIVDTGLDYTHPDFGSCTYWEILTNNCSKITWGYNIAGHNSNFMDDEGHGTHVAGIAAGKGDYNKNDIYEPELGEVWGNAPDAKLLVFKALGSDGKGLMGDVIYGIEMSVDPSRWNNITRDPADILSLSVGVSCGNYDEFCGPDDALSRSVDNAVNAGLVVVVAAGNCGPSGYSECKTLGGGSINSPGTARRAITVGSINKDEIVASTSSRGPVIYLGEIIPKPDVVAPGVSICSAELNSSNIYSECVDNKHVLRVGTSMATPQVAGIAALLIQAHPELTPQEVKDKIKNSAIRLGEVYDYGAGKVNARRALTKHMGDLNNDNLVDVVDLLTLVYGFGKYKGDIGYDIEADINVDGMVDVVDLLYLVDDWRNIYGESSLNKEEISSLLPSSENLIGL